MSVVEKDLGGNSSVEGMPFTSLYHGGSSFAKQNMEAIGTLGIVLDTVPEPGGVVLWFVLVLTVPGFWMRKFMRLKIYAEALQLNSHQ